MSPRMVGPQHLDKCSQRHLEVLYQKAHLAFQNSSRPDYFEKIRTFLGESRHTQVVATTGTLQSPQSYAKSHPPPALPWVSCAYVGSDTDDFGVPPLLTPVVQMVAEHRRTWAFPREKAISEKWSML